MIKKSLTRLSIGLGGLALSLIGGAGFASAAPDLGPAVNSTCTYGQVVAAVNAINPEAAAGFNASPPDQARIQQFLAAPPGSNERLTMAQMAVNTPGTEQAMTVLAQVFAVCNNY